MTKPVFRFNEYLRQRAREVKADQLEEATYARRHAYYLQRKGERKGNKKNENV